MNVLALVSDAFGGFGGIAQYNRDFLAALVQCGRDGRVTVLPRRGHAEPPKLPAGVLQLAPRRNKLGYALCALRFALTDGPFDAVFCGHLNLVPLSAVLCRLIGAPLWLQLHGIEAWRPCAAMQRWAVKRATLITAVSRYTRHQFLRHCDVDPIRVRVLPNTFDSRYTPGQKPEYLLDRYSLHGRKILLTVGRLADDECDKGHDRIIKALPALIATRPDLTYVIVGTGNDRARLEALTDELKLGDHVLFVGMADPQQLPDYYRLADVFAMPSVQEGFGIVFLEAAASGLKLVGGNTDGSVDALADGAIGFSIDPLAPDQLVQAITEVLAGGGPDSSQVHRFSTDHFVRHVCGLTSGYFHGPASAHLP